MKKMTFIFFILTLAVLIISNDARSQQVEPIVIGAPIPGLPRMVRTAKGL